MSSTTTPSSSTNHSIHAIAGAYALAFLPHMYASTKLLLASNYTASNILPRENLSTLRGKIPEKAWNTISRARGAHLNALEGFPLFAAAMIMGNYAKLSNRELNVAAAEYIGLRVVYNVVYLTAKSEAASYVRSAVWAWSIGVPFYVLWKAGSKVASGGFAEKVM